MCFFFQDYCHRIGRTGRAGLEGNSVSFLTNDDTEIMYDLKKMLLKTGGTCPPELMAHEASLRNPNAQFEPVTKPKKKLIFAKK
jgi:ATP-dependent RNA helicase DDX23/PRP28